MAQEPLSPALRIAALEAELEQRERDIAMLKETTQAVGSELDLDTVLQLVVERARQLIDAETVLMPLLNAGCDEYPTGPVPVPTPRKSSASRCRSTSGSAAGSGSTSGRGGAACSTS